MSDWHVLGLEGDPVPGDPDRTAELAGRLLHQAELADGNRERLGRVASGGGELGMQGDYAPKFREVLAELPGELGKLANAYRGAGEALRAFASDLRQERSRAGTALRQGTDAAARYDGAIREIRSLLPGGRDLQVSPMLGVEASVEQATQGLDEGIRAQARAAARRAGLAEADRNSARRLADQAARLRADAEGRAADGINRALDHSGIKNKSWWEKAWDVVSWPFQSWDNFVSFCRGAAFVVGVVALFVSGPVGWALVGVALAAGAVAFGDTLVKFTQGKATLGDLALDALGLIPGSAGAIKLAGMGTRLAASGTRLMAMARNLPETGKLAFGALRNARTAIPHALDVLKAEKGLGGLRRALQEPRLFARAAKCRLVGRDPIDMATGEMILQQDPDLTLPGLLPFTLQRTYRSAYHVGRWFGPSWSSTIEHRLEVDEEGVCYAADDGLLFAYPFPAVGETVLPQEGPRLPLTRRAEGFTVADPASGQTFHFRLGTGGNGDRPTGILPLAAISDRNGHRIDLDYDADGLLIAIRHSGGYHLDVDTQQGLITELRLRTAPGETDVVIMRYDYDESGNLVGIINSSGLPLRFDYDEHGRMIRWEDRNGTWYRYTYDDLDRCIATQGIDGYLSGTIAYNKSERTTVETNSLGHATTYHFNDLLQMDRVVNPLGGVTTYEWDRYDRKLAETDPLGRTTGWTYDEAGNVVAITRPDGLATTIAYNDLRLPVRITGPDGAVWHRQYDERGNLIADTDPLGATATYAYDGQGHLREVSDALGYTRRFSSNAAGLPVSVTDPLGATTRYSHDPLGRVVEAVDPLSRVARFSWTVEGRLGSQTLPDGAIRQWFYDAEGNLVESIGPLGQVTRTEVAPFDRPGAQIGPDGARVRFAYDTELRLVSVTNPQGLVWRYEYDPAGRVVRETDFNGRVLTSLHDPAGQLVERTNGAGETMRFTYDLLGDLTEQSSQDRATRFARDALGRLTRAASDDCELTFEWDALGRPLAETCNGRTVTSTYDVLGRRIERCTPTGTVSAWEYGPSEAPLALVSGGRKIRFTYDGAGREVERQVGDSVALSQRWDLADRLLSHWLTAAPANSPDDGHLIQRRSYTYRADGFVTGVEDLLLGQRRFDLDAAGRITAVTGVGEQSWAESYAYDPAGNPTFGSWPTRASAVEGVDPLESQGERVYTGTLIRRAGTVRYEYDPQGRVVLRQEKRLSEKPRTWHYAWDADDHLTGVLTPDRQRWRYRYDPLGRRIAKERVGVDDVEVIERQEFTWDGIVLIEEIQSEPAGSDAQGTSGQCTAWEWEPNCFRPVLQVRRFWRDLPQEIIDEQFHLIVTDLVGTPTELVSPNGEIGWRRSSTIWGITTAIGADGIDCPLRFPGQYFDPETQMHYNFLRYYDPSVSRYSSTDPVGLIEGLSTHGYVPNPLQSSDPLGLAPGYGVVSRIGEDPRLIREAQRAGRANQASIDHLQNELAKGNMNPGIGSKRVFGDVFEARTRDGARVYFKQGEKGIEIVGKSNKANQPRVISLLEELYG